MIAYLVAEGAKINVRNRDGVTPLIAVSGTSRLDTVSFLVDNGAEINAYGKIREKNSTAGLCHCHCNMHS